MPSSSFASRRRRILFSGHAVHDLCFKYAGAHALAELFRPPELLVADGGGVRRVCNDRRQAVRTYTLSYKSGVEHHLYCIHTLHTIFTDRCIMHARLCSCGQRANAHTDEGDDAFIRPHLLNIKETFVVRPGVSSVFTVDVIL